MLSLFDRGDIDLNQIPLQRLSVRAGIHSCHLGPWAEREGEIPPRDANLYLPVYAIGGKVNIDTSTA